jgi:capsular exopolysaccharide synthesis family protein
VSRTALVNGPVSDQALTEYLEILARRKWWVVAVTVFVVAAALGLSATQVKMYTATAQVLAQTTALPSSAAQVNPTQPISTDQVATYDHLATSSAVTAVVRKKYGITGQVPRAFASVVSTTDLISISATSTQAREAAVIANDYANAFAAYEQGIATAQANSLVKSYTYDQDQLSKQLSQAQSQNNTSAEIAIAAQDALISQDLALAQAAATDPPSAITVSSVASIPASPSSPKPIRNALLGLLLGILLGLAVAIGLDYFADRLTSARDVERATRDLPILAAVPMVESWKKRRDSVLVALADPTSPDVESYWSFRTSLRFLAQERSVRSVVIASPAEGEGKTTTVANLGVVYARSGERTVVVSCDLRRPRLETFLKASPGPGLMSVLSGDAALEDAVKPVDGVPDLWILDTGPLPPDPHRVLSGAPIERVFEELALNFSMVLIDSPPLLAVADTMQLGQMADATVIVVALGQTRKRQLRRALELLDTAHLPLIGVILNEVARPSSYGYGYYGYSGYSSTKATPTKGAHKVKGPAGARLPALGGNAHDNGATPPVGAGPQVVGKHRVWQPLGEQAEAPG